MIHCRGLFNAFKVTLRADASSTSLQHMMHISLLATSALLVLLYWVALKTGPLPTSLECLNQFRKISGRLQRWDVLNTSITSTSVNIKPIPCSHSQMLCSSARTYNDIWTLQKSNKISEIQSNKAQLSQLYSQLNWALSISVTFNRNFHLFHPYLSTMRANASLASRSVYGWLASRSSCAWLSLIMVARIWIRMLWIDT